MHSEMQGAKITTKYKSTIDYRIGNRVCKYLENVSQIILITTFFRLQKKNY